MSDSTKPGDAGAKPGAGEPDAMAKAAKAAKAATRPADAGGPQPMSLSQHLFIWTLVVLVGVIFGVGPSLRDAFVRPSTKIQYGVDEGEAIRLARTARLLQAAIDPHGRRERFVLGDGLGGYAFYISVAGVAAKEGLIPSGKVLARVVDDFLDKTLPDRPGTYRDALREQRGENEVRQDDLEDWLRTDFAFNAMMARNVHNPAVPASSGGQVGRAIGFIQQLPTSDRVHVDEATLTAEPFLKDVGDDDPDLQRTYEELRASPVAAVRERFLLPAVAVLTVAYADMAALEAQVQPTDDEITAYYEANKAARWQQPAKPEEKTDAAKKDAAKPDDKKPEATFKPLDEVKAEIVAALKKDAAQKKARELVGGFADELEETDQPDVAAFTAAAQKAGLQVADHLEVPEPTSGNPVLPGIGELKQGERELGLFSKQPGFVSGAAETRDAADHPGTWLVLRLDDRRARAPRELKQPEVLAYVKRQLAGRRAYADFLAAADKLRADVAGKEGGLRAYLESDAGKAAWKGATVGEQTYLSLYPVKPPPKEIGGLSDEPKPLISLAMPDHPVALATGDAEAELPSVRLIQVKKYDPGMSADNEFIAQVETRLYRSQIFDYSRSSYYAALQHQIGR